MLGNQFKVKYICHVTSVQYLPKRLWIAAPVVEVRYILCEANSAEQNMYTHMYFGLNLS